MQVDGLLILNDRMFVADGTRPIYLVESRMDVFENIEEKALIIPIEKQEL